MNKKQKTILIISIALLIGITFMAGGPMASAESLEKPVIRVGYMENYGIIADVGNSKNKGYGYDYLMEIAKYTGWKYEFVPCGWTEGLEKLASGDIDIFGPMQKNAERESLFDYPEREMGFEYGALYVNDNQENIYYNDLDYFEGMRVGTEINNLYNQKLEEFCQENQIQVDYVYTDAESLPKGLKSGQYDAILAGSILDIPGTKVVAKITSQPFYFATTKGNQAVLQGLNEAIDSILNENAYFAAQLDQKYYGDKSINRQAFTKQEAKFVKEHPILTVVGDPNWSPIEYYDQSAGAYKGISIDLLKEITRHCGIQFQFLETANYQDSIAMVEKGEADLLIGDTEQVQALGLHFTDPFLEVPIMLVGINSEGADNAVSVVMPDLTTKTALEIMRKYPNYHYVDYHDMAGGIHALLSGKEALSFINEYMFEEIKQNGNGMDYTSVSTDLKLILKIGISPSVDPIVAGIFNKAIKGLSPEQINTIVFTNTANKVDKMSFLRMVKEYALQIIIVVIVLFSALMSAIIFVNRKTQRELKRAAYVDEVTGIATLAKLKLDVEELLKSAKQSEYMIVYVDIDNFKYINDSFGYDSGNQVLKAVAQHFTQNKDSNELIARINVDNFVFFSNTLVNEDLQRKLDIMNDVGSQLKNILPDHYTVVFSAGVYVIADATEGVTSALDKANIARKCAKGGHSSTVVEYTQEMDSQIEWKKEVTLSMEAALLNQEFKVYLQPKYSLKDERIVGAEALARWIHPQRGFIAPNVFIPIFEKNGFIQKLDLYMLEQICIMQKRWQENKPDMAPAVISVNLSRMHLDNPFLIEDLLCITQKHGIAPQLIEIELTESLVFDRADVLVEVMSKLKAEGFNIALDDFGSGYSSLNLLKDLPADVLKMDQEFLGEAAETNKGRLIILSIIEMAKGLNLSTVAEGVETKAQADLLREMDCDIAQGYYYAKPMPISEFEKLMMI